MTDLKGCMFISYRRSPGRTTGDAEAAMVCDALRDRGVPTWRDLDDLGPGPTEDELIELLKDGEIAGAVMLVSPEVATSNMVRVVEAPAILDRFQAGDGFLLKVVLINLTYDAVDGVLDRPGPGAAGDNFRECRDLLCRRSGGFPRWVHPGHCNR